MDIVCIVVVNNSIDIAIVTNTVILPCNSL